MQDIGLFSAWIIPEILAVLLSLWLSRKMRHFLLRRTGHKLIAVPGGVAMYLILSPIFFMFFLTFVTASFGTGPDAEAQGMVFTYSVLPIIPLLLLIWFCGILGLVFDARSFQVST